MARINPDSIKGLTNWFADTEDLPTEVKGGVGWLTWIRKH